MRKNIMKNKSQVFKPWVKYVQKYGTNCFKAIIKEMFLDIKLD